MARIADQEYRITPVSELLYHPRNANQGDLGVVCESIEENDFYGAIYAQKSTGYVIAGHTRLKAAIEEGLSEVPVIWIDTDDEGAIRKMIIDNRSTRLGTDDLNVQVENLIELNMTEDGLKGTGYDIEDLNFMMADLQNLPEVESEPRAAKPVIAVSVVDDEQAHRLAEDLAESGHPLYKVSIHCTSAADRDRWKVLLVDLGYRVTTGGETP